MATINMFRGILVAGAVFAAVVALIYGQWVAALILGAGIAMHAALWVRLHRERVEAESNAQTPTANPS